MIQQFSMIKVREALENSWRPDTAYNEVAEEGNPSKGQCYPTSRVLQSYFPELIVVKGKVDTGNGIEGHFWNMYESGEVMHHIDFTWQQFPRGSKVLQFRKLKAEELEDSDHTIWRCETLKDRCAEYLAK